MNPFSTPKSAHIGFTYKRPSLPATCFPTERVKSPMTSKSEMKSVEYHEIIDSPVAFTAKTPDRNAGDTIAPENAIRCPSEHSQPLNATTIRKRGSPFTLPRTPYPATGRTMPCMNTVHQLVTPAFRPAGRVTEQAKDLLAEKSVIRSPQTPSSVAAVVLPDDSMISSPIASASHDELFSSPIVPMQETKSEKLDYKPTKMFREDSISEQVTQARLDMVARKLIYFCNIWFFKYF